MLIVLVKVIYLFLAWFWTYILSTFKKENQIKFQGPSGRRTIRFFDTFLLYYKLLDMQFLG